MTTVWLAVAGSLAKNTRSRQQPTSSVPWELAITKELARPWKATNPSWPAATWRQLNPQQAKVIGKPAITRQQAGPEQATTISQLATTRHSH